MGKDTFYFSHDYNARNDEKIKSLLRKHGMFGYGIFWAIIEELYNNANALQFDCERIAYDMRTDSDSIKSILTEFDLFVFEGNCFGSHSIQKRLEERNIKSKKAKDSAIKRWEKANALKNDANASKSDAIKERKGKEIKGKEIQQQQFEKEFLNDQTLLEHTCRITHCTDSGYKEIVKDFFSENTAAKKIWLDLHDCNKHFVSWLRYYKPKENVVIYKKTKINPVHE